MSLRGEEIDKPNIGATDRPLETTRFPRGSTAALLSSSSPVSHPVGRMSHELQSLARGLPHRATQGALSKTKHRSQRDVWQSREFAEVPQSLVEVRFGFEYTPELKMPIWLASGVCRMTRRNVLLIISCAVVAVSAVSVLCWLVAKSDITDRLDVYGDLHNQHVVFVHNDKVTGGAEVAPNMVAMLSKIE